MHNDALESAIREMRLIGKDQWQSMLSQAMDEQPHLFAFLINTSDDFSEEVHEQLLRLTIILAMAFKRASIQIDTITPAVLDKVIEEKVETYDELNEEDRLEEGQMESVANSPLVFTRVRKWMKEELGESMPMLNESQANMNLMVDVIISVMEESAIQPGDKKEETDA